MSIANAAHCSMMASGKNPPVMPATPVDYISGGGVKTTYIDLGIKPDWSAVYDFETVVYDTSYQNQTICAALDTSPNLVWFFVAQTFNRRLDLNYGVEGADDAGTVAFTNSHKYKIRTHIQNGLQQGWLQDLTAGGDESLVTSTNYPADTSHTFAANLRLFNRTNLLANSVSRLGYTKLFINGVLRFDLQPCLTDENQYTMYNFVTSSFVNKSGTFSGGFW